MEENRENKKRAEIKEEEKLVNKENWVETTKMMNNMKKKMKKRTEEQEKDHNQMG